MNDDEEPTVYLRFVPLSWGVGEPVVEVILTQAKMTVWQLKEELSMMLSGGVWPELIHLVEIKWAPTSAATSLSSVREGEAAAETRAPDDWHLADEVFASGGLDSAGEEEVVNFADEERFAPHREFHFQYAVEPRRVLKLLQRGKPPTAENIITTEVRVRAFRLPSDSPSARGTGPDFSAEELLSGAAAQAELSKISGPPGSGGANPRD